jgi:hypothetical protein
MIKVLVLRFGAMADRLEAQLRSLGLEARKIDLVHWQDDAGAIVRLSVRGLLTDAEAANARRRLLKAISAGVTTCSATTRTP